MKAMILAAGLGTRLRPLTNKLPKALVRFNNKALLAYIIGKLQYFGFDDLIINLHHHAEMIRQYILENHPDLKIEFSDESDQLLDTGGGLYHASWFFDLHEPFLVYNVDIFTDLDLHKLYQSHLNSGALCTLAVSKRMTSRSLLFDAQMNLRAWKNNLTAETKIPGNLPVKTTDLAFSGIAVYSPRIFGLMKETAGKNPCFSIIDVLLQLSITNSIRAYDHSGGKWFDMGKKESYELRPEMFAGCF